MRNLNKRSGFVTVGLIVFLAASAFARVDEPERELIAQVVNLYARQKAAPPAQLDDFLGRRLTGEKNWKSVERDNAFSLSRSLIPLRGWKPIVDIVHFERFAYIDKPSREFSASTKRIPYLSSQIWHVYWGAPINVGGQGCLTVALRVEVLGRRSDVSFIVGPFSRLSESDAESVHRAARRAGLQEHVEWVAGPSATAGEAAYLRISGIEPSRQNFALRLIHEFQHEHLGWRDAN